MQLLLLLLNLALTLAFLLSSPLESTSCLIVLLLLASGAPEEHLKYHLESRGLKNGRSATFFSPSIHY